MKKKSINNYFMGKANDFYKCSKKIAILVLPVMILLFASYDKAYSSGIEGEKVVCMGDTSEYRYCRNSNFPYHWGWDIPTDASIDSIWTNDRCYFVRVKLGKRSGTLKWWGKNPPGLPSVNPVSTYIKVKKCDE